MVLRFTFIPVPRIDRNETIEFRNGKIILNGQTAKAEVWAESDSDAHDILENFVLGVSDNVDSQFSAKLISSGSESITSHPSDPDWAYSRIDPSEIPVLDISSDIWNKIIKQLNAFDDGSWESDTSQSDRFLFRK